MKFRLIFAWYDLWIGMFYDRAARRIFILPFPMIGIRIDLPPKKATTLNQLLKQIAAAQKRAHNTNLKLD